MLSAVCAIFVVRVVMSILTTEAPRFLNIFNSEIESKVLMHTYVAINEAKECMTT